MEKITKYIFAFIATFCLSKGVVSAASLSVTASSSSVTVGSSVIVTVKGSDLAGKFSITSSNGSVLSGGANSFWIENGSVSYTFKANSAGTATITVTPIDASDFSGNVFSGSKSVTVTVRNKQVVVLSGDSSLSSLGIENVALSPEFSSRTTEYSTSLEPDTTSINVIASANHGGASISGAGPREVTDGDNRLEIVVTAENGTSTTYVINANVKEYDPINVKIDNKDYTVVRKKSSLTPPSNYTETTVKINETDVPAYYSEITKYTLVALKDSEGKQNFYVYKDDKYTLYKEYNFKGINLYPMEIKNNDIPKNYKKMTITYNDEEIVAYKIKKSSKYALMYAMNVETGHENLYMYDAKEDTVQIYNTEEIEILEEQATLFTKIAIGLGVLSVVFLGIIITLLIRNKKKNKTVQN